MDRQSRRRRAVELAKDVLIVLLTISALWLITQARVLGPLFQETSPAPDARETQDGSQADARPLRITANLPGEGRTGRYGAQYDQEAVDVLFQQVAGLLVETLSSAGTPEEVSRSRWEEALTAVPGVCLDFQGELPLSVLTGWLVGEDTGSQALVRRLVLTAWGDGVALYYRDGRDGGYYRCLSEVANSRHLSEALAAFQDNGAYYAFESERYGWMDPDTLILEAALAPAVYQVRNPVAGGQSALERVMEELGLPVGSASFYAAGDEQVARIGGNNLRLSARGVLEYHAEEDEGLFPISTQGEEPTLFEAVEACRQLAAGGIGINAGQARLYVASVDETEGNGLEVSFDYCLDGVPVRLSEGAAAWFLVENGQITRFELRYRSYTDSGETSAVLPIPQAAAAMEALDLEGGELALIYNDAGGETVSASWAAITDEA